MWFVFHYLFIFFFRIVNGRYVLQVATNSIKVAPILGRVLEVTYLGLHYATVLALCQTSNYFLSEKINWLEREREDQVSC